MVGAHQPALPFAQPGEDKRHQLIITLPAPGLEVSRETFWIVFSVISPHYYFGYALPALNTLRVDEQRRFWIAYPEADKDICDIREHMGQVATEVKISFPMSDKTLSCNALPSAKEYIQ